MHPIIELIFEYCNRPGKPTVSPVTPSLVKKPLGPPRPPRPVRPPRPPKTRCKLEQKMRQIKKNLMKIEKKAEQYKISLDSKNANTEFK